MSKLRHLFLLLALASPFASAMNALFWQPQLRDGSVSEARWQTLMEDLHRQGFDTLVVQWTRYGDAFSSDAQRQRLQTQVDAARAAGLKTVIGLHADPDFFQRQKQSPAAQAHYLSRLRVADVAQAKIWASRADGWYISAEIDDANWRNTASRTRLIDWLRAAQSQLLTIRREPVYISSFFAGNMTPEGYRQLLEEIRATGVRVWVQDGRGVNTLTANERERYLALSAGCNGQTPADGIVYEMFEALPGSGFRARPLAEGEQNARLSMPSSCGKDSLYFSLRYLPAARGILSSQ